MLVKKLQGNAPLEPRNPKYASPKGPACSHTHRCLSGQREGAAGNAVFICQGLPFPEALPLWEQGPCTEGFLQSPLAWGPGVSSMEAATHIQSHQSDSRWSPEKTGGARGSHPACVRKWGPTKL